jgi:hypothetical protein
MTLNDLKDIITAEATQLDKIFTATGVAYALEDTEEATEAIDYCKHITGATFANILNKLHLMLKEEPINASQCSCAVCECNKY